MLRDASFIDDVPEEHRKDFVDSDKLAPYKLKILKKMIQDRFPVCAFHCSLVANFSDCDVQYLSFLSLALPVFFFCPSLPFLPE